MNKEYKVTPNEDYIDLEDTLIDSIGGISDIERPISSNVFSVTIIIFLLILISYFVLVFRLQIFKGESFRAVAQSNVSMGYRLDSPRGIIYDKFGEKLAYNKNNYNLIAVTRNFPTGLDVDDSERLSVLLDISSDDLIKSFNSSKGALYIVEDRIDEELADEISKLSIKGLYLVPNPERVYTDGRFSSHLLGYISEVTDGDLRDESYELGDKIGRAGIEGYYEDILRGRNGLANFSNINFDNSVNVGEYGEDLVLHIDNQIQKRLHSSLSSVLASSGLSRAAAIVQNPYNGAVLGLVSLPSFDNNLFQDDEVNEEINDLLSSTNKPFFNRTISGQYSPGSTIKPLFALAGLKEKIIDEKTTINDVKGYITVPSQFDPEIVFTYRDWKVQGLVDLKKALAQSSDIFFYSVGGGYGDIIGLGIGKISEYLKIFLADEILGIDLLGEKPGFVPSPKWKEEIKGEPWFQGDTYNVSIGQGDLLVTPLWMNTYISSIVNGGTIYKPQVLDRIVDSNKKTLRKIEEEELDTLNFSDEEIALIEDGMREAVISGTARLLSGLPKDVAAKTGTAEVLKGISSNSLLTVYAPYRNPEIVVTIVVENIDKNQQSVALLATQDFLNWYLSQ